MLGVVLGLSAPVVAFGLATWWARAQAVKLEIVDLTSKAPTRKRSKRSRPVDAVVLHQMSFSRGNDLQKYLEVTAHFVITPNGTVGQLHPMSARLDASHGFNGRSVAIEFAGNLQATTGDWWSPETHGRNQLTTAQIEAGRKLLNQLTLHGVRFVFGHRQSYVERGNDPGPEIWSSVAQWGISKLRLSDGGPAYAIGSGRPIPAEWRTYTLDNRKA